MNGILLIDKEKNYTSRDIVNIVGSHFNTKKVGHTGTLDPIATGVLVLTIGKATKVSELLVSTYKEYIAEVTLGIKTDTYDITGNVLEQRKIELNENDLVKTLNKFQTRYMQEVPIYSAVKVNGKKLYEYARNGEKIELPKKEVDIKEIELLEFSKTKFKIRCLVSKGTYIRSLINDICNDLNIIGTMSELRRTKQGEFNIENCYKISDLENSKIISLKDALKDYLKIEVDDYLKNKISNGAILENRYNEDIIVFVYQDDVLAIYKKYDKDNTKIKPWKVFC